METGFHHNAAPPWTYKDPESVLDYSLNWATWLGMDTISSVVWRLTCSVAIPPCSAINSAACACVIEASVPVRATRSPSRIRELGKGSVTGGHAG